MLLKINLPPSEWAYRLSGVYKITFVDGYFYIGCSNHLRNRAQAWSRIMILGKGIPGKTIGTKIINKILEKKAASFDIIEMCGVKDLKDKEAFYLNKNKEDEKMLSSNDGAWKPVLQYSEDGTFIKKHLSIGAAARYNKTKLSYIQYVLNGVRKSHKGMVFIYEQEYDKRRGEIIKARYIKSERKRGRNVLMIDQDGSIVNTFKKIVDAAREIGVRPETVRRVISGCHKTSKGYRFKYE